MRTILLSTILLLAASTLTAQPKTCEEIFEFIYTQWGEVETMRYHSEKKERTMDEYTSASFEFTVQRKPLKIAGRMEEKGHYILFDPTVSKTEAYYISNGFPYTNLSLDVNGRVFRGLNHYTITDAGAEFIFGIVRNEFERMKGNFWCEKQVRKGREEWAIQAKSDDWHYLPYEAELGENVLDIARKLKVSAYLIVERNESVDEYLDDCTGLTLEVPSHYGMHVRLNVDAEHGMPTLIEIHDEKGLMERYEYSDYRFGLDLPENYFTVDYLDDLD